MLGAAQSDALGAERAGATGILGSVGIGADPQGARGVGPLQDLHHVGVVGLRRDQRRLADVDGADGSVDRDDVALVEDQLADRHRAVQLVDLDGADAADGGFAHPDRHDRRVRGLAAACGQDALRLDHSVQVVGRGLLAHQDDAVALLAAPLGLLGVEHDRADGRAGAGVDATCDRLAGRRRVELWQQQLADLPGVHQVAQRLVRW